MNEEIYDLIRGFEYFKCINKEIPFILSHPLFSSSAYMDEDNNLKNVTYENFNEVVELHIKRLKDIVENEKRIGDKIVKFLIHINKPYRLEFFNLLKEKIETKTTYNELLYWIWCDTEFPHQIGINKAVLLFKNSKFDIKLFSDKEDFEFYNNLNEKIIIYRGLQGKDAKIRGLSWSLNKEKAIWFANRFKQKGNLYQAEINKRDIYAYTNSMGEEEIIINPRYLKNIQLISYD